MGTARAGAVGTAGADPTGGLGTNGAFGPDDSVSFRYDAFWFAPVSTPPPRFFSFGMPPTNKPANCGAGSAAPPLLWSLLLALFTGTGGARPPGTAGAPLGIIGTGGAPPVGIPPPPPPDAFATWGAERSFVTAFLRALPFDISLSKAPRPAPAPAAGRGSPPGGGGGGGGPPMPGSGGGGGGGGGISEIGLRLSWYVEILSHAGEIEERVSGR